MTLVFASAKVTNYLNSLNRELEIVYV